LPTIECYTLSLHDALPIFRSGGILMDKLFCIGIKKISLRSVFITTDCYQKLAVILCSTLKLNLSVFEFLLKMFVHLLPVLVFPVDRKSTRLNSSHVKISYA